MSVRRLGGRAALVCVGLLAAMAFGVVSASAETAVFKYTGAEQKFKVPAGVTSVQVEAVGSGGGTAGSEHPVHGGVGAVVSGDLAVTPGQVLYVEVGGLEFNGGAHSVVSAAGGGASDLRMVSIGAAESPGNEESLKSRLLVAAGGGGGGGPNARASQGGPNPECLGGPGGGPEEKGTDGASCGISGGGGGGPGKENEGGSGGNGYVFDTPDSSFAGEPGRFGAGGGTAREGGGGGGGGGLYGGGGGGEQALESTMQNGGGGGGGGGSNLVPKGGESKHAKAGQAASVTITYTLPASAFPLFAPESARSSGSIPYATKTVTLETVSKHKISCLSREGSFQVESEYTLRLSLYMYSCTSQKQPCYTSIPGLGTQPQGQMLLEFLGQLVSLSREKHTVAVLFSPYNGAAEGRYEEFQVTCRNIATYYIGGQVLAPISPVNRLIYPPATFALKLAQKAGVQNPGLYQGSGPITLTTSLTPPSEEGVEAPVQTGFAFSSPLTFSEPLEIDG